MFRPPTNRMVHRTTSERFTPRSVRQHLASGPATRSRHVYSQLLRPPNRLRHLIRLRPSARAITRIRLRRRDRVATNDLRRFFRRRVRGARAILRQTSRLIFPVINKQKRRLTSRVTVPYVGLCEVGSNLPYRVRQAPVDAHRLQRLVNARSTRGNEEMGVRAEEYTSKRAATGALVKRVTAISRLSTYHDPLHVCNVDRPARSKSGLEARPRLTIGERTTLDGYHVDGDDRACASHHCQPVVIRRRIQQDISKARTLRDDQASNAIARDRQSRDSKNRWLKFRHCRL